MTERLTRSHRREIENKMQQKIDLDNLAKLDVDQLVSNKEDVPPVEEIKSTEENVEERANEESSDEDSSEEGDSEDEESSAEEEDDEDLDALLNKAQEALKKQSHASIQFEQEGKKTINTKLSQMDIGLSVEKVLYLNTHSGRAKLVTDAVVLEDDPNKKSKKSAVVVLKPSKDDDSKKMNKKERQLEREKTTGSAWFDMPKAVMTDEIKRDLQILKMRHILDRKRHYKKMGKKPEPKYFQIGTIIESPTEFFSARINKKDRKQTIVDELMASDEQKQYYKRKYNEVQDRTNSGGKKHFKKLKAQRQWAK